ncbi:MAG: asparagine synthase (glutamine-hydrolyzing) [Acidobacteria bacterium]|nr:asparagine synthase (glutamine-hydrolyzing) [Acidobacteriota bacterium]
MSGISAIFRTDGREADPVLLRQMTDTIARRGPDGQGLWIDGAIGLAHNLLHTTPESLSEKQPLVDSETGCRLIFDGRVDNREELVNALRDWVVPQGTQYHSPTDPDLVLQAYKKWNTECPKKILGEFAFVLWDPRSRRLFCARDRMGLRLLHYRWSDATLWVSSEIKPLLDVNGQYPEPDDEMILALLLREFREGDEGRTFFRDIRRLPPAHTLVVENGQLRLQRYWAIDPTHQTRYSRQEEYVERLLALFKEVMRSCTRSAFPMGVFLSGGLDSASVACMAAKLSTVPIKVFTIYGDHPDSDERRWARQVAQAIRAELSEFHSACLNPLEDLDDDLDRFECPVVALNRKLAAELGKLLGSRGCRAILSGAGGDQILDEYGHAADLVKSLRPWRIASDLRTFAADYGADPWSFARMAFNNIVPQIFKYWGKHIVRGVPPYWMNRKLALEMGLRERTRRPRHTLRFPSYSQSISYLETFNPYHALSMEVDERSAARQGVEVRYPYLDSRLVEFMLSIPPNVRTVGGKRKYLLRRAMEGVLPEATRLRQGKGDYTDEVDQSLLSLCRRIPPEPLANSSGRMERYLDFEGTGKLVEKFIRGKYDFRHTIWLMITIDRWLLRHWKGGRNA